MTLSRRKFLITSGAAFAVGIIGVVKTPKAIAGQSNATPGLLTPDDPRFNAYLDTYFPGLRLRKRFASLRPFSALIVNTGSDPVFGYTLKWSTLDSNGLKDVYRRKFASRPSTQLLKRQYTGQTPFLMPGDIAVVTPLFFWPSSVYQEKFAKSGISRKKLFEYQERYPTATAFVGRNSTNSNPIAATIGATITASGVSGAMEKGTARAYRNQRNAERDQALWLYQCSILPDGTLDKEALTAAINDSLALYQDRPGLKHRIYARARVRFAEKVRHLANINSADASEVRQTLAEVAHLPKTYLT
jgi:hypothetical protein